MVFFIFLIFFMVILWFVCWSFLVFVFFFEVRQVFHRLLFVLSQSRISNIVTIFQMPKRVAFLIEVCVYFLVNCCKFFGLRD
jgi:hypothetical protein